MEKVKTKSEANPMEQAGIFSKLTFGWLFPLYAKGFKHSIEKEDLFNIREEDNSQTLGDLLSQSWDNEVNLSKVEGRKASYVRALFRSFGLSYCLTGILIFVHYCIFRIAQPLFLGGLIRYFNSEVGNRSDRVGIFFAFGIVMSTFLALIVFQVYTWRAQNCGMKIRIASCSLLYRKATRLSSNSLEQVTIGQMVNLLSNDVSRFDTSLLYLHNLWIGPLQTIAVTILIWQELGPSCLAGIGLLILFVPFQSYIGKVFFRLRLETAQRTDERMHIMNEVMNSMRVIKMYVLEKPFTALIEKARMKEMSSVMKTNYYKALNMSFFILANKIILFLALLVFVLTGNILTAEKVFVFSTLINNVRVTMGLFFPLGISVGSEMLISCKRIQDLLELEEKEDSKKIMKSNLQPEPKDCYVETAHLCARWFPSSSADDLENISFNVAAGQLLAIVGIVGSGKSSILHAILGELPITMGSIKISGKVAYVSQEPWLFAGTAKENILFGQPFNSKRYHEVLRVCALEKDLKTLTQKDLTTVGERGVALSGGQRARISLARAVYFDADIYLLDDPLSAVDSCVGKHLFRTVYLKVLVS